MATTVNNLGNFSSPTDAYIGVVIAVVVAAITYGYYNPRASKSGGIYHVPGISIITARTFFKSRFDFLQSNFKYHDIFQFKVLHVRICYACRLFYVTQLSNSTKSSPSLAKKLANSSSETTT
jgi:hypothetical protein